MSFTGRAIYLPENERNFARVNKIVDGEVVRQQKVQVDTVIEAIFSLASLPQQIKIMLEAPRFVDDVFLEVAKSPKLKPTDFAKITSVLNYLFDKSDEHKEKLEQLLTSLVTHFSNKDISMNELLRLYKELSLSLKETSDKQIQKELFIHLLSHMELTGEASNELLEEVMNQLLSNKNPKKVKFIEKLAAKQQPNKVICSSPILPKGTVVYQETSHGNYILAIEVEAEKRDVQFYQTTFEDVGYPKLLFVFQVNMKKQAKASLFSIKDSVIKESTKLYHYPFANVYGNGACCWPELNEIVIESPVQLSNMVHLYFNSPHNNHLFNGENLREQLSKLQNQEFDHSSLKPIGTTFGYYLGLIKDEKINDAAETA